METIKTIIDTDILIDLLRNKKQAITFLASLEAKNLILCTTAVNIFELHHGAHKSEEPEKNVQAINIVVNRLAILPLTSKVCPKSRAHLCGARKKRSNHWAQRYSYRCNRLNARMQYRYT